MTNPYAPSTVEDSTPGDWSATRLHRTAGCWLIVSGLFHLVGVNLLAGNAGFAAIEWTPIYLSVLGVFVVLQFRLAIMLARLFGSVAILGMCLVTVALLADWGNGGELAYGDVTVADPQPWQSMLVFAAIGGTMIPPWWMLQRALAGTNRVHRQSRLERMVG